MSDASGQIVGILRRYPDGSKRVMRGHHPGLYLPVGVPRDLTNRILIICEGATDTAAALDLGFAAVGRFSCTHGVSLLTGLIRSRQPALIVMCADAEPQEQQGAEALAGALLAYTRQVKVITPPIPHKDLRAWRQAGADRRDLQQTIYEASIHQLRVGRQPVLPSRRHQ